MLEPAPDLTTKRREVQKSEKGVLTVRTSKVALHGGGASKVSSFYEDHWTLFVLIDLITGLAKSITLEPPGTAGVGFEFFVDRPMGREWHQVKHQNSKLGKWSFAELKEESVLGNFKDKLATDAHSYCIFVSAHAAHPLAKLCDHAAESESFATFVEHFLSSGSLLEAFIHLYSEEWNVSEEEAWAWLHRRIQMRTIDARTLEEWVSERARTFLTGDPEDAVADLLAVTRSSLYRPLDRGSLIEKLAARGTSLRDWTEGGVPLDDQVLATARDFVRGIRANLVNASFMARAEVSTVLERLRRSNGPASLLISGTKGRGKSAVLAQAVSGLLTEGIKVLTVDVTRLVRETSSLEVGKALGLSVSPAAALAAAAGDERAVLAVDSLDSLGVNRDKPVELFRAVSEILREAAAHPNISVLVSCRTEDLDADTRLRALVRDPDPAEVVEVGLLSEEQAKGASATAGHDIAQLGAEQLRIIRKAANLRVFTQLPPAEAPAFKTEQELLDGYVDWAVRP